MENTSFFHQTLYVMTKIKVAYIYILIILTDPQFRRQKSLKNLN